mgnify:CR=1 FL=1
MADETEGAAATAEPEPAGTQDDGLGDAGKAAIAAERQRANAAEKALKALQKERDQLAEASQTETEKAIAAARKEAQLETSKGYQSKILNAEIRAQAAGKFSNPKLAARLLDLDADEVFSAEGDPDAKKIAKAIDEFLALEENAGLRAGHSSRPSGDADAGKGNGAPSGDMNDFIRAGIGKK